MTRISHIARRALLALHDCLGVFVCATLVSCAFAPQALAYVDPSVMTYTIQAIAGVVVALSAVAGVAFRRSRKAIMRMLRIDEDAHKETDQHIYLLDEDGNPIFNEDKAPFSTRTTDSSVGAEAINVNNSGKTAGDRSKKPKRSDGPKRLKWPSRLWRSALGAVFLAGTVLLVAPYELVAANTDSLIFTLADVWQPVLIQTTVVATCLALALSLFWGRGFDFVFALTVALGLCFYLQANFMNQTLPVADGASFDLSRHITVTAVSTIVWLLVVAGTITLIVRRQQFGRNLAVFVSVALIIVQGAAVASLWFDTDTATYTPEETESIAEFMSPDEELLISREGLFDVSPSNNVIIFALDTVDVVDLDKVLAENPRALSEFSGFTYFSNSSGSLVPTRYGIPFLLTGSWPRDDQTWSEYLKTRYSSSTFLDDIVLQGYSAYVYTDTPEAGGTEYMASRAVNIHPVDKTLVHTETTFNLDEAVNALCKMALYRDMPWLLKEPFWFTTDAINRATFNTQVYEEQVLASEREGSTIPYVLDDAEYYQQLLKHRLRVYDDGATGSVRFIHLFGTHIPYTLDENVIRRDGATTDANQQLIANLVILSEYFSQMKELGVYDDATIIVTSDHGYWYFDDTIEQSERDGDMAGGAIMLVKPAGESSQPLVVSEARTGHLDFHATVIDAIGGDASRYGTTVFQANDPNRTRYYYWLTHNGVDDLMVYEYAIDGEVTDWHAWSRTDRVWDGSK